MLLNNNECHCEEACATRQSNQSNNFFLLDCNAPAGARNDGGVRLPRAFSICARNDRKGIVTSFRILTPIIALFILPLSASAQSSYGFPDLLQGAKIPELVNRLVYATLSVVGALFFLMFLWGGVMYLTAGGTAEKVKKATQILTNAVIGLVIVALSYTLVAFVIDTIVKGQGGETASPTPATSLLKRPTRVIPA